MMQQPDKRARLAALKERIRRLEGLPAGDSGAVLPLGIAAMDAVLPGGGLPRGCVHEIQPAHPDDTGAATAFLAALAAGLCNRGAPLLWIGRSLCVHPPGLAAWGVAPARLIFVEARAGRELLWALEEALRCPQLGGVMAELDGSGPLDLSASRRLQLAAEAGGVTGLLLTASARPGIIRHGAKPGSSSKTPDGADAEGRADARRTASAAVTRWRIAGRPGLPTAGEPGVGQPSWQVELLRCRGGRPGSWRLAWSAADGHLVAVETSDSAPGPAAREPARRRTVGPGPLRQAG